MLDLAMTAAPILDDSGVPTALAVVARDITERKRAEREHALLAAIVESSDDAIVSNSLDQRIITWNKGAERLFGFTAEEAIGQRATLYMPPELKDWGEAFLNDLTTRLDNLQSFEVPCVRKDGSRVDVWTVCAGIRDYNGKLVGISAIHRDMTQRKRSEREAVLLAAAVNASEDAIISVSPEAKIITWNPAATKVYGYTAEEAFGKSIELFVPPEEFPQTIETVRRVVETRQPASWEQHVRRSDGTSFISAVSIFPICDAAGNVTGVAGIGRDISALKETERQLVAAREAALAASRAKSEFLSSMSHEIRTPMNAVLGMCELLSETELNSEQRRYLEVMSSNGASLLDLINSILDLAKIESGRLQIERTEFDFSELIERTLATFAASAHGKGLELAARIAPGVPNHLVGDPLRLRQVLVNLIGNAIKFTELGEVVVVIENDPEAKELGSLRFTVSDTGIGISADKINSIFSSFTQADSSTTRKYGGSGLGLAIVERLVGLMGGRIWVESQPRQSSKFIFTANFGLAPRIITATHQGLPDLAGMRVLVVDDNATNREIAREMVVGVGAKVAEADSGPAALVAVQQAIEAGEPFRLILLDMRMPEMDGLEVATRIRRDIRRDAPLILMLSSDDLGPQLSRLREAELNAYLIKPITRRELFQAISKLLAEDKSVRVAKPAPSPTAQQPADPLAARILVAEDSPDNRLLISAYLQRTQCQIDFAENGQVAVEKFTRNHYDLVLMDLQMPVMDGYAATRAIRAWELQHGVPRTNVLALTASALEEVGTKTSEAGCDAHVSKPIKKTMLLAVTRQYASQPAPSTETTEADADPGRNGAIRAD